MEQDKSAIENRNTRIEQKLKNKLRNTKPNGEKDEEH